MATSEILTKNLRLQLQGPAEVLAWIEGMTEDERAQVSPAWLARARAATTPDPWAHGFTVMLRENDAPIGSCAFKGPPDADAVVEIAYGIDPAHQGKGFATEAAQALTAYALRTGLVRVVRAHTLPEENASTRVLKKCNYQYVGEVIDPEDGRVWRWEMRPSG
jgi:[ribosomal protein S5]-alanine N-acetyltransferase